MASSGFIERQRVRRLGDSASHWTMLTPLGRQEDGEEPPGRSNTSALGWIRHHDKYSAKRGGQGS